MCYTGWTLICLKHSFVTKSSNQIRYKYIVVGLVIQKFLKYFALFLCLVQFF